MNNAIAQMDKVRRVPTPRIRVSQRPGFVPLMTGDPIPDELRESLDVEAYVYELRQIALQMIESELEP